MLRMLRKAVHTLFWALLIMSICFIFLTGVMSLMEMDFGKTFVFPGTVVLSSKQALGIAGGIVLIVICLLAAGSKIDELDEKLASIALTLEHLEPLVKKGRVLWEHQAKLEDDRLEDIKTLD